MMPNETCSISKSQQNNVREVVGKKIPAEECIGFKNVEVEEMFFKSIDRF